MDSDSESEDQKTKEMKTKSPRPLPTAKRVSSSPSALSGGPKSIDSLQVIIIIIIHSIIHLCSFIHTLIHLFVCSFLHVVHFVHSFVCSFIHSFVCVHSLVHFFIPSFVHSSFPWVHVLLCTCDVHVLLAITTEDASQGARARARSANNR